MYEAFGDFWGPDFGALGGSTRTHYYCIPTNGETTSNGLAVMGRGIAAQAAKRFPHLPIMLGDSLRQYGNHVVPLGARGVDTRSGFIAFPTKNKWRDLSSVGLIERSANELAALARWLPEAVFILPRPGCGAGGLSWEDIHRFLGPILSPGNIYVIAASPD